MLFQGGNFLKNDEKKGRKTLTKWTMLGKKEKQPHFLKCNYYYDTLYCT